ncbi:CARD- and ANK-domain containing inflammasome adapter protein-like [Hordeum vulgare subsp. vulgare]|uniref:CARD- and ANK-domain containing inflammasome adapter protein-like n=1 Tax=Hordeum vulgare subsp. vulgare TaxID=112509 RepID=UPI001D1A3830|nr:CARD- and ANK-domain containing inflammasome adapter protein-like [Hordeum vulgare subsp. vulgare]
MAAGKSPEMMVAEKIPDTAKKSPNMAEKRRPSFLPTSPLAGTSVFASLVAEFGAASVFASLTPADLVAALSLCNEDGPLVHVAATSGHPKAVTALVAAGGDAVASAVNGKDEEGWAPIHSVASSGSAEIVDILLEHCTFGIV